MDAYGVILRSILFCVFESKYQESNSKSQENDSEMF